MNVSHVAPAPILGHRLQLRPRDVANSLIH
jgi:hypothetical protein